MLKAVLVSREEIPEGLEEHYAEDAKGRFVLQMEGAETEEGIANLRKALKTERERREAAESRLEAFGDTDPEGLADKLDRLATLEDADTDHSQKLQEAAQRAAQRERDKWTAQVGKLEKALEKWQGVVHKKTIHGDLDAGLAEIGVTDPVYRKAAKSLLLGRGAELSEDGDDVFGVLTDDYGEKVRIPDFLESWKATPEAGKFITASGSGGSDVDGSSGPPSVGGVRRVSRSDPTVYAKYKDEIQKGTVELVD